MTRDAIQNSLALAILEGVGTDGDMFTVDEFDGALAFHLRGEGVNHVR
jgi:hypothetical protein